MIGLLLAQTGPVPGPPASPSYSSDGRLAVTVRGDLWVSAGPVGVGHAAADWIRVTSGPALDVDPTWSRDGRFLIFASDRGHGFDLWRVPVAAHGPADAPERLTSDPLSDRMPSVAPNGAIVFVRGSGSDAAVWIHRPDATEARLEHARQGAFDPAMSPDGAWIVYGWANADGAGLRRVRLDGSADSAVVRGVAAERPAWSPDGGRIVYAVRRGRPGVWVTDRDGRYENLVSRRSAAPAWSPDGGTLALTELPGPEPDFNGDPDRLGDREAREIFGSEGFWLMPAPSAPDRGLEATALSGTVDLGAANAEAFDRVWERVRRLYYEDRPGAAHRSAESLRRAQAEWARLRGKYRPQAIRAEDGAALESVVHRMLEERPPLRDSATGRAAVSSANPDATAAGLEILRRGGNVVDAAVAVSFALGVVEPEASGIGGYGQMLIWRPGMQDPKLIEFMTRTPQDATLDNGALTDDGEYPDDGPVLTQVPGTLAGMYRAWKEHGSLPWSDLLQPAIRLAADGFEVSDGLATTLTTEREHFLKYDGSRRLFFPGGEPLQAGDTLRNPDLAATLKTLAAHGADAFYHGDIGRRMVEDLRAHGSPMRLRDVERYYAAVRDPVAGRYRGYTVYSSAPPSAGGATLTAKLNLLENFAPMRRYTDDAATLHAMIEAWKLAPSTRGRIADPGLWPVTLEPFTSKDTARFRWRCFDPGHATSPELFDDRTPECADARGAAGRGGAGRDSAGSNRTGAARRPRASRHSAAVESPTACVRLHVGHCHSSGTTAFVVADADGDVVSVTQTLGTWGGTFYVSPGLGFTYNDKLTSYALDPGSYGARLPNSRHGSTISPTLVFRGSGSARRPVYAFGTAGNAWITAGVYEELVALVDFGLGPQAALEMPRFLVSGGSDENGEPESVVLMERGFAPEVVRRLEALGHSVRFVSLEGELREGYGAALEIGSGKVTAGADPRRGGAAGAIR